MLLHYACGTTNDDHVHDGTKFLSYYGLDMH